MRLDLFLVIFSSAFRRKSRLSDKLINAFEEGDWMRLDLFLILVHLKILQLALLLPISKGSARLVIDMMKHIFEIAIIQTHSGHHLRFSGTF
jgi:hypothetical protein